MAAVPLGDSQNAAALPSTRLEAGELAITGPAGAPAYLIIGAIPQRRLPGGVLLDVAPEEIVPFRFDERGRAQLSVPAPAAEPGAQVQVVAFDQRRSQAVSIQPPLSLDLGQAGAQSAVAGPGSTLGAAQGGKAGEARRPGRGRGHLQSPDELSRLDRSDRPPRSLGVHQVQLDLDLRTEPDRERQGTSLQATTGGLGGLGILIGCGGEAVPFKQL